MAMADNSALFHEPSSLIPNEIANLRADLTIYQASIPCELRSSNGNFRYWAEQNKGGVRLRSVPADLAGIRHSSQPR